MFLENSFSFDLTLAALRPRFDWVCTATTLFAVKQLARIVPICNCECLYTPDTRGDQLSPQQWQRSSAVHLTPDELYARLLLLNMTFRGYQQITKERFEIIHARYRKYLEVLNDPNSDPVSVFDPLNAKQLQELDLIREVSKELQFKKEEDMKKAAQDKIEEEERAANKLAEEKAAEKEKEESEEPKKEE